MYIARGPTVALTYYVAVVIGIAAATATFLLAARFDGIGASSRPQVVFLLAYAPLVGDAGGTPFFNYNVALISRRIGRGQLDHCSSNRSHSGWRSSRKASRHSPVRHALAVGFCSRGPSRSSSTYTRRPRAAWGCSASMWCVGRDRPVLLVRLGQPGLLGAARRPRRSTRHLANVETAHPLSARRAGGPRADRPADRGARRVRGLVSSARAARRWEAPWTTRHRYPAPALTFGALAAGDLHSWTPPLWPHRIRAATSPSDTVVELGAYARRIASACAPRGCGTSCSNLLRTPRSASSRRCAAST